MSGGGAVRGGGGGGGRAESEGGQEEAVSLVPGLSSRGSPNGCHGDERPCEQTPGVGRPRMAPPPQTIRSRLPVEKRATGGGRSHLCRERESVSIEQNQIGLPGNKTCLHGNWICLPGHQTPSLGGRGRVAKCLEGEDERERRPRKGTKTKLHCRPQTQTRCWHGNDRGFG